MARGSGKKNSTSNQANNNNNNNNNNNSSKPASSFQPTIAQALGKKGITSTNNGAKKALSQLTSSASSSTLQREKKPQPNVSNQSLMMMSGNSSTLSRPRNSNNNAAETIDVDDDDVAMDNPTNKTSSDPSSTKQPASTTGDAAIEVSDSSDDDDDVKFIRSSTVAKNNNNNNNKSFTFVDSDDDPDCSQQESAPCSQPDPQKDDSASSAHRPSNGEDELSNISNFQDYAQSSSKTSRQNMQEFIREKSNSNNNNENFNWQDSKNKEYNKMEQNLKIESGARRQREDDDASEHKFILNKDNDPVVKSETRQAAQTQHKENNFRKLQQNIAERNRKSTKRQKRDRAMLPRGKGKQIFAKDLFRNGAIDVITLQELLLEEANGEIPDFLEVFIDSGMLSFMITSLEVSPEFSFDKLCDLASCFRKNVDAIWNEQVEIKLVFKIDNVFPEDLKVHPGKSYGNMPLDDSESSPNVTHLPVRDKDYLQKIHSQLISAIKRFNKMETFPLVSAIEWTLDHSADAGSSSSSSSPAPSSSSSAPKEKKGLRIQIMHDYDCAVTSPHKCIIVSFPSNWDNKAQGVPADCVKVVRPSKVQAHPIKLLFQNIVTGCDFSPDALVDWEKDEEDYNGVILRKFVKDAFNGANPMNEPEAEEIFSAFRYCAGKACGAKKQLEQQYFEAYVAAFYHLLCPLVYIPLDLNDVENTGRYVGTPNSKYHSYFEKIKPYIKKLQDSPSRSLTAKENAILSSFCRPEIDDKLCELMNKTFPEKTRQMKSRLDHISKLVEEHNKNNNTDAAPLKEEDLINKLTEVYWNNSGVPGEEKMWFDTHSVIYRNYRTTPNEQDKQKLAYYFNHCYKNNNNQNGFSNAVLKHFKASHSCLPGSNGKIIFESCGHENHRYKNSSQSHQYFRDHSILQHFRTKETSERTEDKIIPYFQDMQLYVRERCPNAATKFYDLPAGIKDKINSSVNDLPHSSQLFIDNLSNDPLVSLVAHVKYFADNEEERAAVEKALKQAEEEAKKELLQKRAADNADDEDEDENMEAINIDEDDEEEEELGQRPEQGKKKREEYYNKLLDDMKDVLDAIMHHIRNNTAPSNEILERFLVYRRLASYLLRKNTKSLSLSSFGIEIVRYLKAHLHQLHTSWTEQMLIDNRFTGIESLFKKSGDFKKFMDWFNKTVGGNFAGDIRTATNGRLWHGRLKELEDFFKLLAPREDFHLPGDRCTYSLVRGLLEAAIRAVISGDPNFFPNHRIIFLFGQVKRDHFHCFKGHATYASLVKFILEYSEKHTPSEFNSEYFSGVCALLVYLVKSTQTYKKYSSVSPSNPLSRPGLNLEKQSLFLPHLMKFFLEDIEGKYVPSKEGKPLVQLNPHLLDLLVDFDERLSNPAEAATLVAYVVALTLVLKKTTRDRSKKTEGTNDRSILPFYKFPPGSEGKTISNTSLYFSAAQFEKMEKLADLARNPNYTVVEEDLEGITMIEDLRFFLRCAAKFGPLNKVARYNVYTHTGVQKIDEVSRLQLKNLFPKPTPFDTKVGERLESFVTSCYYQLFPERRDEDEKAKMEERKRESNQPKMTAFLPSNNTKSRGKK